MAKWEQYSKEEIQNFINNSKTKKEMFYKMGYQSYHIEVWNKIILKYPDLNYEHFGKKKNLVGQKFNKLFVVEEIPERRNNKIYWKCKCDCGNPELIEVSGSNLKTGAVKSCGCLGGKYKDLTGQKFGKYTVIKRDLNPKHTKSESIYYFVQCDCGNEKLYSARRDHIINQDFNGCEFCNKKSVGELKIKEILDQNNICYKEQISFPNLKGEANVLRFDFGLYRDNTLLCLIEINGIQHYEPVEHFGGEKRFLQQKKYDNLKVDYCKNYNIPLIIIPYYEIKDINKSYLLERIKLYV